MSIIDHIDYTGDELKINFTQLWTDAISIYNMVMSRKYLTDECITVGKFFNTNLSKIGNYSELIDDLIPGCHEIIKQLPATLLQPFNNEFAPQIYFIPILNDYLESTTEFQSVIDMAFTMIYYTCKDIWNITVSHDISRYHDDIMIETVSFPNDCNKVEWIRNVLTSFFQCHGQSDCFNDHIKTLLFFADNMNRNKQVETVFSIVLAIMTLVMVYLVYTR